MSIVSRLAERRLVYYFFAMIVPVLVLISALRPVTDLAGHLMGKTAAYQGNPDAFELVLLGDSRTYCAFHPPFLENLVDRRVANLASWSHWLPTQYAQFQDLIAVIPAGTTVVWSVGFQNFKACQGCSPAAYPIGRATAEFYEQIGLPPDSYAANVQLSPLRVTHRGFATERLPEIYEGLLGWLMQPLKQDASTFSVTHGLTDDPSPMARVAAENHRPNVADARLLYSAGKPTSIEVRFNAGGYERIELDPAFFREAQSNYARTRRTDELQAPYMSIFEAILDLFAAHDVRVIVNIMEESPHTYVSREIQLAQRRAMDTTIRSAVEARGFTYVRVDWDLIESSDYFDYNHLNGAGARAFMTQFADAVVPMLEVGD